MNALRFQQIKEALKTKRAKTLLVLGVVFVIATWAILSVAFSSLLSNDFNDSFWVLAGLELLLAGIALMVCSKFGGAKVNLISPKPQIKNEITLRSWIQKLFRH